MTDTELARRLERLERDHRRLKGFALAVLVLAAASAVWFAIRVPSKIVAHGFDVVDGAGSVRVHMGFDSSDSSDYRTLEAGFGRDTGFATPLVELFGPDGELGAVIGVRPTGDPEMFLLDTKNRAALLMGLRSGKPGILLANPNGFRMRLGSAITDSAGETSQTTAPSIAVFGSDKDHRLIWQAPASR
ncbi:MAG TPA: hypothetical protein VGX94_12100 [Terriglobia bacterium]|nr:hypothetical protein [Terriglobia bacterium]